MGSADHRERRTGGLPGASAVPGRCTNSLDDAPAAPPPPPPVLPGTPTAVAATPGLDSASVTWSPPVDQGSYPVTSYRVTSRPGGRICLAEGVSCNVGDLEAGTTYTFSVQALTAAGWGPSAESSPVTMPVPTIVITGMRPRPAGQEVKVSGSAQILAGERLTPWVKAGRKPFTAGSSAVSVRDGGTFVWTRKSKGATRVYFTWEEFRSNTVSIPAAR